MTEIYLHREDLVKMIQFIDTVNPEGTTRLQAGTVRVTYDNSSGIGAIIKASCPHEYQEGKWGELTVTIEDESSW
jgi:hypothetical protein